MTTHCEPRPLDADWSAYRAQGTALYTAITTGRGRLLAAIDLARALQQQPLELKQELPGLLLLLESARGVPDLREPAVQLAGVLEPWLDRMENWSRWEMVIRYVAGAAAQLGLAEYHVRFLVKLSRILLHTGRVDEASQVVTAALDAAHQAASAVALAKTTTAAVEIALVRPGLERARVIVTETQADPLIQNASGVAQAAAMSYLDVSLAVILRQSGSLDEAVGLLNRTVRRLELFPDADPYLRATAFRVRGVFEWSKGLTGAALHDLRRAARLFTHLGDHFGLAMAFANLGLVYRSIGRLDASETATRSAISAARQWDAPWLMAREIGNLGLVSLFQGRLKEAERLVKRHLQLAARLDIVTEVGRAKGNLGIIYLHQGRYKAARTLMEWDRDVAETHHKLEGLAVACANLSRCYASLGEPHLAEAEGRRALALAEQLGSASMQVMALRALAESSPPPQARQLLEQAYARAEGMRFDRAACRLALAALDTDSARRLRLWDTGRRQLIQMGAAMWLAGHTPDHPPRLPTLV